MLDNRGGGKGTRKELLEGRFIIQSSPRKSQPISQTRALAWRVKHNNHPRIEVDQPKELDAEKQEVVD